MYRRNLALALGLLAGLGTMAQPPVVMAAPWSQGVTRRAKTPRRAFARLGAPLPGKKGTPQKHGGKACRHSKPARNRRRAAKLRGR